MHLPESNTPSAYKIESLYFHTKIFISSNDVASLNSFVYRSRARIVRATAVLKLWFIMAAISGLDGITEWHEHQTCQPEEDKNNPWSINSSASHISKYSTACYHLANQCQCQSIKSRRKMNKLLFSVLQPQQFTTPRPKYKQLKTHDFNTARDGSSGLARA